MSDYDIDRMIADIERLTRERDEWISHYKGVMGALTDAATVPIPAWGENLSEGVRQLTRERDEWKRLAETLAAALEGR